MDKAQAIHSFWSSFELPAYEENTVPEDAVMPYITYNVSEGEIDNYVGLYGSVWYYGTSWEQAEAKAKRIKLHVVRMNPIKIDEGYLHISLGTPASQHLQDENDMVRRIYINLQAEFFTES